MWKFMKSLRIGAKVGAQGRRSLLSWDGGHIGSVFTIDHDGQRYLTRFILFQSAAARVFLHRIHRPDADRDMHNHPWDASCLILRGGYTEISADMYGPTEVRHYRAGSVNTLEGPESFHRIVSVRPNTWTLVFAGPYVRTWGFLLRSNWRGPRFVGWREYLNVPEGTELGD